MTKPVPEKRVAILLNALYEIKAQKDNDRLPPKFFSEIAEEALEEFYDSKSES